MNFIRTFLISLPQPTASPAETRVLQGLLKRKPSGFTLVETLVALSIIAIVLVAVYRLQTLNLTITGENDGPPALGLRCSDLFCAPSRPTSGW